jgi:hypothetical protein
MKWNGREVRVGFRTQKLKDEFEQLKTGKTEERGLAVQLTHAIDDLERNPFAGVRVPKPQWPREYSGALRGSVLLKYDLRDGWRLMYTLRGTQVDVIVVLLEWLSHKEYGKRFGYRRR